MHVLIADDEAPMRILLAEVLLSMRMDQPLNVVQAEDGQVALELLQQTRFDLVICDNQMPHITGMEVFEYLCAEGRHSVPFLLTTGDCLSNNQLERLNQYGGMYLPKPFGIRTFLAIVAEQLQDQPHK